MDEKTHVAPRVKVDCVFPDLPRCLDTCIYPRALLPFLDLSKYSTTHHLERHPSLTVTHQLQYPHQSITLLLTCHLRSHRLPLGQSICLYDINDDEDNNNEGDIQQYYNNHSQDEHRRFSQLSKPFRGR
jgi:hypothetical protein